MKNQLLKKLLKISILLFFVASIATDCKKDDKDDTATTLGLLVLTQQACLQGEITSDRTISGECNMRGTVFVKNGATLTIEAGSKILGETGSSLFILPGSKIIAVGTASNPIVFTSAKPEGERKMGDWGGITIIGNSLIDVATASRKTEGTDPQAYGTGSTPNDNSGTLKYVRIEFAGYAVSIGNELNSLSLYAVGSGTTIEYVQIHFGLDDAIEIFGGRVQPKYLLLTGTADDDVDIDEGYYGTIQYVLAYRYKSDEGVTFSDDPRFFEIDGAKSNQLGLATATDKGATDVTIQYYTMVQRSLVTAGVVRDCANAILNNGDVTGVSSNVSTSSSSECTSPASNANVTGSSQSSNTYAVTTHWKISNPNTPPVFNIANVKAFPSSTNWTTGWTIWRHN